MARAFKIEGETSPTIYNAFDFEAIALDFEAIAFMISGQPSPTILKAF